MGQNVNSLSSPSSLKFTPPGYMKVRWTSQPRTSAFPATRESPLKYSPWHLNEYSAGSVGSWRDITSEIMAEEPDLVKLPTGKCALVSLPSLIVHTTWNSYQIISVQCFVYTISWTITPTLNEFTHLCKEAKSSSSFIFASIWYTLRMF